MKKIFAILFLAVINLHAQQAPVNIKGTFEHNKKDSLTIRNIYNWHKAIALDKKGSFAADVQQGMGMFVLNYGSAKIDMFLANESEISLKADADNLQQTLVFEGSYAAENNFLAQKERDKLALSQKFNYNDNKEKLSLAVDSLVAKWKDEIKKGDFHYMFKNMATAQLTIMRPAQLAKEIEKDIKARQLTGKPSPGFNYEDHKGGTKTLEDFKGKYVYIDVWATWCGPCREQIPMLQVLEDKYKDKNIAFISISIDKPEDREKWRSMVTEKNLGGTQLLAENAWKSSFTVAYGIHSIPRFILLDPKGNVIETDAKRPVDPDLEKQLDTLLKY